MAERSFIEVTGGAVECEFEPAHGDAPTLVYLHEGLGSIELWRGVPAEIGEALGDAGYLVFARHGHGGSSPARLPRPVDYMHHEADEILPEVLSAFALDRPVLVGHSDGASIALLYAGSGRPVTALVCLAPHVMVEDESIAGIEAARVAFETTDLAMRFGRYHNDPEATFRGWNDVWLSDEFRSWNIEDRLPAIDAPLMLVQGSADDYGTFAQLDAIERAVRGRVDRWELEGVGHAPHLDARDEVVTAIVEFVKSISPGRGRRSGPSPTARP